MRVFHVLPERLLALPGLPPGLPEAGFLWIGLERQALAAAAPDLQQALQRYGAGTLVDLHLSDLLNPQLPSHFEDTSWYDLLVFRRLAAGPTHGTPGDDAASARQALASIDTEPVGFAVFDRVLVSVHPPDCAVRDHFARRLAGLGGGTDLRNGRMPAQPADLMLRMVNHVVDSYLDLRRLLTPSAG